MLYPSIFGENLFDDFFRFPDFGRDVEKKLYGKHAAQVMKTDVHEHDDHYVVDVDLPGFKKEDINIDVENDCLTISVERKVEDEDKRPNYVKRERVYGSFSRSFDVSGINVEGIQAAYNDGILTLTMPKKVEQKPAKCKLEIK